MASPIWALAAADGVATLVIFAFSLALNNSSMYDLYWSVAPPLLASWIFAIARPETNSVRQLIVLALVWVWAIRLTSLFTRVWPGVHHEDWRYVDMRKSTGKAYWLVS